MPCTNIIHAENHIFRVQTMTFRHSPSFTPQTTRRRKLLVRTDSIQTEWRPIRFQWKTFPPVSEVVYEFDSVELCSLGRSTSGWPEPRPRRPLAIVCPKWWLTTTFGIRFSDRCCRLLDKSRAVPLSVLVLQCDIYCRLRVESSSRRECLWLASGKTERKRKSFTSSVGSCLAYNSSREERESLGARLQWHCLRRGVNNLRLNFGSLGKVRMTTMV